jgi:dolichol kinase
MIIETPFFVFLILIGVIFLAAELLLKRFYLNPELTRKSAHILSGLVVFLMPSYLNLGQAVVLGVSFAIVLYFAEKLRVLPSVTRVNRSSLGSVLFPLGLVISGLLFWDVNIIAFKLSVLVLALSDSMAGLVGYKFGKRKFLSGTIEGSSAFFVVTFAIFVSFGLLFNNILLLNLFLFAVISLILTLVEARATKGLDNLLLPPVSGFLASLMF